MLKPKIATVKKPLNFYQGISGGIRMLRDIIFLPPASLLHVATPSVTGLPTVAIGTGC